MAIETFKLYDQILVFFDSYPRKMESEFNNHFRSYAIEDKIKEGIPKLIEKESNVKSAFTYLQDAGYIKKQGAYFELSSIGREKILKGFEQTYLEEENQKLLVATNLTETTELAKAQKEEIKKSKIISWLALGISFLALGSQIFTNYYDYLNNGKENRSTQSPSRDNNMASEIKDSTNKTSEFPITLK